MLANSNLYDNIPQELKNIDAWIVWRYEEIDGKKPTKVPYCVKTGHLASTTNPASWCSFLNANGALNSNLYSGLGFVFTDNDEYCFIDLDYSEDKDVIAKQLQIQKDFDSYSEISPSGKGLHIIIKGSIPKGIKRNCIEIYSSGRYACMTGNVFNNKPIKEYQEKLTELYNELSGEASNPLPTSYVPTDQLEKYSDEQIIEQCRNAVNGDKFKYLWNCEQIGNNGSWIKSVEYPSQSEADQALINMIVFYTENREQIERLFHQSKLGKRDKAKRKSYLNYTIKKAFDQKLPTIDFDGYEEVLEKQINNIPVAQLVSKEASSSFGHAISEEKMYDIIPPPKGKLGEIVRFIYEASPHPVYEFALAAAITLISGICGRAYNTSTGAGLNQYILAIGGTGVGKDAMASGIDKLMDDVSKTIPDALLFQGFGNIVSGQAIARKINKFPHCMFGVLGEFGLKLKDMLSPRASSADITTMSVLLKIWSKSGYDQTFHSSIYSKDEDTIPSTNSPALTILAESTPDIYETFDEKMLTSGLLSRFIILEYKGKRKYENMNARNIKIPTNLSNWFIVLIDQCFKIMNEKNSFNNIKKENEKPLGVRIVPEAPEVNNLLHKYSDYCTDKHNLKDDANELWGRSSLMVRKLSTIYAISDNVYNPIVTLENVNWSINFINYVNEAIINKFRKNEVGTSDNIETKQIDCIKNTIREWLERPWDWAKAYCDNSSYKLHKSRQFIPREFFNLRTSKLKPFKFKNNGGITPSLALNRCIQIMIDCGKLIERKDDSELFKKYEKVGKIYEIRKECLE